MPRQLRQAQNRELFRAVNDRIAALGATTDTLAFICECSQLGCSAQINAPLAIYASVRQRLGAYLVAAGHEDAEAEYAIFGHNGYRIVLASRAAKNE